MRGRFPLVDGWVILGPGFLPSTGHFMKRLLSWMVEEGFADQSMVDEDWSAYALHLLRGERGAEHWEPIQAAIESFFATRTSAETIAAAVERRLLIAPLLGLDEIIDSEQLTSRDFVTAVEQRSVGKVGHPGPWARFGATPLRYLHPPPAIDGHRALLDDPPRTPVFEAQAQAQAQSSGAATSLPLEGVKILDLFWVLAGPGATRMLADYGATVVHVESTRHLDTLRVIPPYHYSNPHPECAGGFQSANANKLGLTLDIASEEGRKVVLDLVRWADVVTESFAPGVMESYGLSFETLREHKPDLIMISSCLMGQTGPWRTFTGFGNLAATVTAFQQLASWPGRPPSGPFGAYTDFIAVRYNALAILGALEHRARTGEGQYIDQSQAESGLHFLAPAFLDYTVNGNVQEAVGNEDGELFPHGVFPVAGEDRWVAIAVRDDREWQALCRVMEQPDLAARRNERKLALEAVSLWTRGREGSDIEQALQAVGVPAHRVLDTSELFTDAQLQERGHYIEIGHDIFPTTTIESTRLVLSGANARVPQRALTAGRDNREVLEDLLGYTPERIAELAAQGILL